MYPVYAKGRNVQSQGTILWIKHVIRIFSLSFAVYGKLADTGTGPNFSTIFNKWWQHHHPPQHAAIWILPTVCAAKSSWHSHYLWLIIAGLQPQCPCHFAQAPSVKISQTWPSSLGTAVAQWLRFCATNRKVAGSIPACVGIFHWHKILPIALWPWGRLSL